MSQSESGNNKNYSNSLFSGADSTSALARVQQEAAAERRRRLLFFMKYLLPACILLLVMIGFVLRQPVQRMFRAPEPFPAVPEAGAAGENESAQDLEKSQQRFGNPAASMRIYLRFMDEQYAPEGIVELARSAVDSKPSEIFLILDYRPARPGVEKDYQILINDKEFVTVPDKETEKIIDLKEMPSEEDFILALEHVHAEIYGQVNHPLKLKLSQDLLEKRRKMQEASLPAILPEKGAATPPASGKTIILPDFKADTTVISPR